MTRAIELTVCLALLGGAVAAAQPRPQTPPPPPPSTRGGSTTTAPPATQAPATRPATPAAGPPATGAGTGASPTTTGPGQASASAPAAAGPAAEVAPTEAQLGVPIYPGAKFLRSFDAGQGQRYYLFGSTATFGELVLYYRTQLKDKGDLVYDVPPVHMFEVGRFREETMAFPPGVTVKDYTYGGGKGYLVPTPGANPSRYPTIIQIVPVAGR